MLRVRWLVVALFEEGCHRLAHQRKALAARVRPHPLGAPLQDRSGLLDCVGGQSATVEQGRAEAAREELAEERQRLLAPVRTIIAETLADRATQLK